MTISLHDKIRTIYSELTDSDFCPPTIIQLRDDSDGLGAYIAKWEHPSLPKPTQEQLDAAQPG